MISIRQQGESTVTGLILRVIAAEPVADRIRWLRLARPDGAELPAFTAGAHVEVTLPDGQTRPYSLIDFDATSAAPDTYHLGVLLETEGRGGSMHMHALSLGDTVTLAAPKTDFPLHDGPEPALLIAGGIGVTPMISMATALKAQGRPYRLVYAGRSAATMAFADRLAAQHGAALTLHHDDAAGGPLDLRALIGSAAPGTQVYVCGPRPMIEAAREIATAAGLPVHFESFDAVTPQEGDTAFEVEVASTGAVFTIPPGRTIVEVLEEAGMDLMHDCLRGDCGICQTEVLAGVPDHRDVVLTDAERAEGKLIHICVSRAKSPRLTLDL
jgi:vanillate O-demethylase ferredoxin subunit